MSSSVTTEKRQALNDPAQSQLASRGYAKPRLGEASKIVSERLGHGSIAITKDIYLSVLPSMQRAAADHFAELIG